MARLIADLHIHSKYSRATSKDLNLDGVALWAFRKGIDVVSTGDITHPEYFESFERKLTPYLSDDSGLYTLKTSKSDSPVKFMLTGEVSNIYKQGDKTRKIHNIIFAPNLETVKKINKVFDRLGNIHSDGRPIFGFTCQDLIKIVMDAHEDCMLVPAHAWTPWFSIFGSKSGFDSIEECFGDYAKYIYAIETGLSSDPKMNRRLSMLDDITLISNSDAHSPSKLGREANVFHTSETPTYKEITDIIKTADKEKFLYTIEFHPEEGKYHYDGHRNCKVVMNPEESKAAGGICPKCEKPLTIGTMYRVDELADRPKDYDITTNPNYIPSKVIVPLDEIISEALQVGVKSKAVQKEYMKLTDLGKNEFNVLLDMEENELLKITSEKITEGILKVRSGDVSIAPGYDGEFGKISLFKKMKANKKKKDKQLELL